MGYIYDCYIPYVLVRYDLFNVLARVSGGAMISKKSIRLLCPPPPFLTLTANPVSYYNNLMLCRLSINSINVDLVLLVNMMLLSFHGRSRAIIVSSPSLVKLKLMLKDVVGL